MYPISQFLPFRKMLRKVQIREGKKWSGRKDLNLRPPGPEPGALARLRYAPTMLGKELPKQKLRIAQNGMRPIVCSWAIPLEEWTWLRVRICVNKSLKSLPSICRVNKLQVEVTRTEVGVGLSIGTRS